MIINKIWTSGVVDVYTKWNLAAKMIGLIAAISLSSLAQRARHRVIVL